MTYNKKQTGALTIDDDKFFADNTARDAYFVANPTELVTGVMISVGTNYEQYDGSGWQSKTSVVKGQDGSAATITVGTVTTGVAGSSATVTNVGTSANAIFDFSIPRGADGTGGGGSATWGGITGTLSAQTDLNSALSAKQATLVSGTNIKTVNGTSLLGSGNVVISGGAGAVDSVNTKTGTVTLNQDEIPDGTTYKQYSQTEKTKLSGIATGAQVNTSMVKASATDTTEGYLGDKLVAGTNVTITKNNSGGNETYTIASTASGGSGVTVYADLATIKAVTTMVDDSICIMDNKLYIYNPVSTQKEDDFNVIKPTSVTNKGRWELQSLKNGYSKIAKSYNVRHLDRGCVSSYSFKEGKLHMSKTSNYKNGLVTEDSFMGAGKLFNFRLPIGIAGAPMMFFKYNGSYAVKTTSLVGFTVAITTTATTRITEDATSTFFPASEVRSSETVVGTDEYSATVKMFNNRISIVLNNENKQKCYTSTYKDLASIASNVNANNGFTQNSATPTAVSDIFVKDITSYLNLVLIGDSNTYGYNLLDRADVASEQLRYKTGKNAIDIYNSGVSGCVTTDVISKLTANIPDWVQANAYSIGDLVTYTDGKVYRCTATVTAGTAWSTSNFLVQGDIGSGVALNTLLNVTSGFENVAVVNIGVNDVGYHSVTPADCFTNLETIVAGLRTAGYSKVYVCTLPMVSKAQASYATINPLLTTYNNLIKSSTTADGIIDIDALTNNGSSLPYEWAMLSDGLHYSKKTNDLISDSIIETLQLYKY